MRAKHQTSIALCTYNGARFLPVQLDSFARQTILPGELVVNDDCSTDETVTIVNEFARRAPFPVLLEVNPNNLGSTKNFERAIERCSGELIFLSDQDDVWDPAKISVIEAEFERSPETGMVFSNARLVGEDGRELGGRLWDYTFRSSERRKSSENRFYTTLLKRNVVTGATMAFRSKFTPEFRPIPTHLPNTIHDGWIAIVVSACSRIVALDLTLIDYRLHSGQQLGIGNEEMVTGTPVERFSKTIGFLKKQMAFLEVLGDSIDDYPSLKGAGGLRDAIRESRSDIGEYISHLEKRIAMAGNRSKRLRKVADELKTGRYHRFSRGLLSSIKDVLGR